MPDLSPHLEAKKTWASRVEVLNTVLARKFVWSTYTLDDGIAFVTTAARRLRATFSVLYTLPQSLLVEGDAND